ncbi:MAG: restriction endonuclease [Clostridia bacterium]|nr:restriction endonuclease [Clostridia bacterium]
MPVKRRKKRRESLGKRLAGGILDLIDGFFRTLGRAFFGLLRLIGRFLGVLARGLLFLLHQLIRLICLPFQALFRHVTGKNNRASRCLRLTGEEFEEYAAAVLRDNGFKHIEMTPVSGDQGVDILCERGGKRYAIQCKNYQGSVGNAAVQEAYAGMQYYDCDVAVVLCPGTFTASARRLAQSTGVLLWGETRLTHMMQISGRRP